MMTVLADSGGRDSPVNYAENANLWIARQASFWKSLPMADNRSGAVYYLGGMPHRFVFRPGCTIVWGKPDSPRRALCAICHGALPDVPLMLWQSDGSAASFCEGCIEKWIEIKQCST